MKAIIESSGRWKPGDPEPQGYLAWHEWASVQHRAGLRQQRCKKCGKWKYPQSLDSSGNCTEKCNDWSQHY